ncbi:MAG: non-homologous end joining protein Ku [Acidimicrobiales bacterium]
MPRAIWSGAISFGLVNVPVKLFSAVSPKDVRFHQLEVTTNARVRQKRVSSATGEEVPFDQIVKGYEVSPETYVVVTPEELEDLDPKATRTIDIEDFVGLSDIDPIFFERPYYVVPDKGGTKAYALLVAAMRQSDRVAIARLVLRTKQYLAALRPVGDTLVLETLLYADEVVPADQLEDVPSMEEVEVSEREVTMAQQLIESLATSFEPERYHDTYRERVLDLIEQKAAGQAVVPAAREEEPTRVVDLMAALEASVAAAREARAERERERERSA